MRKDAKHIPNRFEFNLAKSLLRKVIDNDRKGYEQLLAEHDLDRRQDLRADMIAIVNFMTSQAIYSGRILHRIPTDDESARIVDDIVTSVFGDIVNVSIIETRLRYFTERRMYDTNPTIDWLNSDVALCANLLADRLPNWETSYLISTWIWRIKRIGVKEALRH